MPRKGFENTVLGFERPRPYAHYAARRLECALLVIVYEQRQ